MATLLYFLFGLFYLISHNNGNSAEASSFAAVATGCGCCPQPWCSTKSNPCSSNGDCECLLMTMTGSGLCADTVISCSHLTRCEMDNVTCLEPNTVCVNNTRCDEPVCYPVARASSTVCPPMVSRYVSSTNIPVISSSTTSTIQTTISTTTTTESTTTTVTTTETTSTSTTTDTTTTSTTTGTTSTSTTTETTSTSTTTDTTTTSTTTGTTTTGTTTINMCLTGTRCMNNGTCQPSGSTFFCICPSTHYGTRCETLGAGTDLSTLERILNGSLTSYDKTVENVLNRTHWTNIVAVVDVTGSMQPCAAAVYKWMKLAHDRANLINYYVFFNDGDNKADVSKVIGSTGGIYGIDTSNLFTVLATMETAMKNGNGGDGPENDIEAILYGIARCPTCSNVILIADNQVTPRDLILLSQVTKPVKVITCQLYGSLNPKLIDVASRTNGSIHTLQEDITNLSSIPVGGSIIIGHRTYQRGASGYSLLY